MKIIDHEYAEFKAIHDFLKERYDQPWKAMDALIGTLAFFDLTYHQGSPLEDRILAMQKSIRATMESFNGTEMQ